MMEAFSAKSVGRNIARCRNRVGWTQAELAERLGVSNETISRLERGDRGVKAEMLFKLSEALHVSCDVLIYGETDGTHLQKINRILSGKPEEYLASLERLLRVCNDEFAPKKAKKHADKDHIE